MFGDATRLSAFVDRRKFLALAGIMGLIALVPLSGCTFFGEPDKSQNQPQESLPTNAANFDGLVVYMNFDQSTWQWSQINNPTSEVNGGIVAAIPVTIVNNDELGRVLNYLYCKFEGPNGTIAPDISAYYPNDDIFRLGSIEQGATIESRVHVLYTGSGTYTMKFDNLLGRKATLPFEIKSASASGLLAIPDSLGQGDVAAAVPAGTAFELNGLLAAFSPDAASYWWTTVSSDDGWWNGRWVVGVPMTVVNTSEESKTIPVGTYACYTPSLARLDDPAPFFPDSATYTQPIAAGETRETLMFWIYAEDGDSYVVFDAAGVKVVATVNISQ
ncbi:MAG: hypothetical protein IKE43_04500 [Coriobacteriales bacterium]|nr:hypothetical protein [Coriobacteriales bacterium]